MGILRGGNMKLYISSSGQYQQVHEAGTVTHEKLEVYDESGPLVSFTMSWTINMTFYRVPYRYPIIDPSLLIAAIVQALRRLN